MTTEQAIPNERRLVMRLLNYWRGLTDGETFPSESKIDSTAIADMWPHCAVLDVAAKEADPKIAYVGIALIDAVGMDISGKRLSQVPADTLVAKGFSYFGEVLVKKVPITYGGEFVARRGVKMRYRSIILPLAENGVNINRLLAAELRRDDPVTVRKKA